MKQELFSLKALFIALILFGAGYMPQAFAIQELEPNGGTGGNTSICFSPQDLGSPAVPFSIEGVVDTLGTQFWDEDYFKFVGTPGDTLVVEIKDTSAEPVNALEIIAYDSSCRHLSTGLGAPTRKLALRVPEDGVVILFTTVYNSFAVSLPYQISLQRFASIGSIRGQVVNADTGAPWPADGVGINIVDTNRCDTGFCIPINTNPIRPDSQGNFIFSEAAEPGTFELTAISVELPGVIAFRETFTLAASESKDVGVIKLKPREVIGSITGRLVDAVSGAPLPGNVDPFAQAVLSACTSPTECSNGVAFVEADSQGRFKFTETNNNFGANLRLSPGLYAIKRVIANQYGQVVEADTAPFNVLKDENRDIGDVRVQSLPVRFSNNTPCTKPTADSSKCVFSVRMTNGLATVFNGETWGIVNTITASSGINFSSFQTNTERLSLKVGESRIVKFAMPLPTASVPNNANICADAYVGKRPNAVWNIVGRTNVFCMTKSAFGLSLVPAKEAFEVSSHLK